MPTLVKDNKTDGPYSGYRFIRYHNDVCKGEGRFDEDIPDNVMLVLTCIHTKHPLVALADGSYVTNEYWRMGPANMGGDPSYVVRNWQYIVNTYNPATFQGDRLIDGGRAFMYAPYPEWLLKAKNGFVSVAMVDSPPLPTPEGLVYAGVNVSAYMTEADMEAHGLSQIEHRTKGTLDLPDEKLYRIPNGHELAAAGGYDYANRYPTFEQGRAGAGISYWGGNGGIKVDQITDGGIAEDADGLVGFYKGMADLFPNAMNFGGYGMSGYRFKCFDFMNNPLHPDFTHYYTTDTPRKDRYGNDDLFYRLRAQGYKLADFLYNLVQSYQDYVGQEDWVSLLHFMMDVHNRQDPARSTVLFAWFHNEFPFHEPGGETLFQIDTTDPLRHIVKITGAISGFLNNKAIAFYFFMHGRGLIMWANAGPYVADPNRVAPQGNPDQRADVILDENYNSSSWTYQNPPMAPDMPQSGMDFYEAGRHDAVRLTNYLGMVRAPWEWISYRLTYTKGYRSGTVINYNRTTPNGVNLLHLTAQRLPLVKYHYNLDKSKKGWSIVTSYFLMDEEATIEMYIPGVTQPVVVEIVGQECKAGELYV
jgi:hypothetical protein